MCIEPATYGLICGKRNGKAQQQIEHTAAKWELVSFVLECHHALASEDRNAIRSKLLSWWCCKGTVTPNRPSKLSFKKLRSMRAFLGLSSSSSRGTCSRKSMQILGFQLQTARAASWSSWCFDSGAKRGHGNGCCCQLPARTEGAPHGFRAQIELTLSMCD